MADRLDIFRNAGKTKDHECESNVREGNGKERGESRRIRRTKRHPTTSSEEWGGGAIEGVPDGNDSSPGNA